MMTVEAFMLSHDRDVLDLQDDPTSYINEIEAELAADNKPHAFDVNGNKVWSVALMRAHLGIQGEALWPEPSAAL
jgi:hypothetical protein